MTHRFFGRCLAASLAFATQLAFADGEGGRDNWPMYGRNPQHTFTNAHSDINVSNVGQLVPAWTYLPGDAVSAAPTVVDGVVYIGAWDGRMVALDQATGAERWHFDVDCDPAVIPVPPRCLAPGEEAPPRFASEGGLIVTSAAVVDGAVYFAGGKTMYKLRARDGRLLWKRTLCGRPEAPSCEQDSADPTQIFSSPVVHDGRVFVGQTVNGVVGYRGAFSALDARNGALVWRFEVDPVYDAGGRVIGGLNRGCGPVWSSGAIDEANDIVVFATGDCEYDAPPPYHEAVVALRLRTGHVAWTFRPRATDTCDYDFGASPNVVRIGRDRYIGEGGKDGTYYLLRADTGALAWSSNVVAGGSSGGFIGSTAFDGTHVFGSTGYGELGGAACHPDDPRDTDFQGPTFHAFNVETGAVDWEWGYDPFTTGDAGFGFGASTVASGVVFSGWAGLGPDFPVPPALRAWNAETGELLGFFPAGGAVNSAATVTRRMIIFGAGNSYDGAGGAVIAYRLP